MARLHREVVRDGASGVAERVARVDDVRRLDLVDGGVVVQRERARERERLANEVDRRGPVLAGVELVVACLELEHPAVDAAEAVDVGDRSLGAVHRAGKEAGHRASQGGDVAERDRGRRHADVGGAAVAALGRRGRGVRAAAGRGASGAGRAAGCVGAGRVVACRRLLAGAHAAVGPRRRAVASGGDRLAPAGRGHAALTDPHATAGGHECRHEQCDPDSHVRSSPEARRGRKPSRRPLDVPNAPQHRPLAYV